MLKICDLEHKCVCVYPPASFNVFTPVKSLKPVISGRRSLLIKTHARFSRRQPRSGYRVSPPDGAPCVFPRCSPLRFDLFFITCWSEQLTAPFFSAVMWHLGRQEGGWFYFSLIRNYRQAKSLNLMDLCVAAAGGVGFTKRSPRLDSKETVFNKMAPVWHHWEQEAPLKLTGRPGDNWGRGEDPPGVNVAWVVACLFRVVPRLQPHCGSDGPVAPLMSELHVE